MTIQIYHNPRCSKSRQTLELLRQNNIEPEIILYLEKNPIKTDYVSIVKKLGVSIREIIRKGEQEYKDNNLSDKNISDEELINYLVKFPKLLERPIVINYDKAKIGRPPENILSIL